MDGVQTVEWRIFFHEFPTVMKLFLLLNEIRVPAYLRTRERLKRVKWTIMNGCPDSSLQFGN